MEKVLESAVAPAFCLPASDGTNVCLEDFRGKVVVLYFYPKDDTPSCTTEACGFRDLSSSFAAAGAEIVGVSPDSVPVHQKFSSKQGLPFLLLADENHAVAEEYGVWDEKIMYGRTYMGIVRSTFVIDKTGIIRQVYRKVKVKGHMEAVLEFVKLLQDA